MKEELTFLGIIQIPLAQVQFVELAGERLYNEKQANRLERLFGKTQIDHQDHKHWIDAYVDISEASAVYGKLGLSYHALQQANAARIYPLLDNHIVRYTQGRHRVEAARKLAPSSWWTVSLYATSIHSMRTSQLVKRQTERFQHETPYTDGHIYCKLREYDIGSCDYMDWHERLSEFKQKALEAINRRLLLAGALDKLIDFPGVIDDLHLGNCHKWVSRLGPEAHTYLSHTYRLLSHLTGGSRSIQRHFDPATTRILEGRAPASDEYDHQWIQNAFQTKEAFSGVTDPLQRREIEQRTLEIKAMIPSLRTFQANILYLSIAAQIVWSLLIPKEGRKMAKREEISMRALMRTYWVASPPYVEVEEGVFQPTLGQPSFDLAYNTVILAALRQFPLLSLDRPKVERGEEILLSCDPICQSLFQRRAWLLGFRNSRIKEGITPETYPRDPDFMPGQVFDKNSEALTVFLQRADRRWGRPHARIFRVIHKEAFLPRIFGVNSTEVTVLFVLRDFLQAFFNPCAFEYDSSRAQIHMNLAPLSLKRRSAAGGFQSTNRENLETIREEYRQMETDEDNCNMDIDSPSRTSTGTHRISQDEDVIMSDEATALAEPSSPHFQSQGECGEQAETSTSHTHSRNHYHSFGSLTCARSTLPSPPLASSIPRETETRQYSDISSRSRSPVPTPRYSQDRAGHKRSSLAITRRRTRSTGRAKLKPEALSNAPSGESQVCARYPSYSSVTPRSTVPTPPPCSSNGGVPGQLRTNERAGPNTWSIQSAPRSTVPTPSQWSQCLEPQLSGSIQSGPRSTVPTPQWSHSSASEPQMSWSSQSLTHPYISGQSTIMGWPQYSASLASSSAPRSTCPTPPGEPTDLRLQHREREADPGWQGFIDSDDSMTTISL